MDSLTCMHARDSVVSFYLWIGLIYTFKWYLRSRGKKKEDVSRWLYNQLVERICSEAAALALGESRRSHRCT